ncbi:MAG: hypothetical protein GY936_19805 [Ignavibacteriae bacterium]|nr:hypothetical protein [Ignavibacteriota bacterium]
MKKTLIFLSLFLISTTFAQITIDGDFTDWTGVPLLASDALNDDNGTGWDIDKLYITDDHDNVYFRVTFANTSAGNYDLYLEISVDPASEPASLTGHSWGQWDNGYDFMLHSYDEERSRRHLSESESPAVNGWDWEILAATGEQAWTNANDYSEIEMSFPKSALDNPNILG